MTAVYRSIAARSDDILIIGTSLHPGCGIIGIHHYASPALTVCFFLPELIARFNFTYFAVIYLIFREGRAGTYGHKQNQGDGFHNDDLHFGMWL